MESRAGNFLVNSPRILVAMMFVLVIAVGLFVFINECAYGGAMGAALKTCDCAGLEWRVFDRTPSDGPLKTVCFGVIRSTTCYQSRGGPEIECDVGFAVGR